MSMVFPQSGSGSFRVLLLEDGELRFNVVQCNNITSTSIVPAAAASSLWFSLNC